MKVPFWFASFFAKKTIRMKAREESIIYAIPIAVFRPFVANNAAVLNFLLETLQLISPVKTMKTRGSLISDTYFIRINNLKCQILHILRNCYHYGVEEISSWLKCIVVVECSLSPRMPKSCQPSSNCPGKCFTG
jgi:uncharacterized membrane protein